MDHQTWFEKFIIQLNYDDEQFYHPAHRENRREKFIQATLVKMALHALPSLEKKVAIAIFFDNLSEREIARRLKISKTRVHRIKTRALKTLAESPFVKMNLSLKFLKTKSAV